LADLDGNGKPDLIWQHDGTRQVSVWYMGGPQGTDFLSWEWISSTPVPGWRVAADGDFNGDARPDLVWQENATGKVSVWFLGGAKGNEFQGWAWLSELVLPSWKVVALADLDGNGKLDLIWQHETTWQVSYWLMSGALGNMIISTGWIVENGNLVLGWRLVGAADLDGNGKRDLIWQNDSTQQVLAAFMGGSQGATVLSSKWIAPAGVNGWRVIVP
jgi:hypothetical protein